MKYIVTADLTSYQIDRGWIDQCDVNSCHMTNLNTIFPMLPTILGCERISPSESVTDGTTLELGNTDYHSLPDCYQSINSDRSIMSCSDFSTLTIDQCVEYLNLLNIKFSLPKGRLEYLIGTKFFSQKIPARSIYGEDIQRYIDKVTAIVIHDDVLKPMKEFNLNRIINVLNQIYSAQDQSIVNSQISDLSNYDLSYMNYLLDHNLIVYDQSRILYNSINDLTNYINDFTNLFIDKTCSESYDSTFINYELDGTDQVGYMDNSVITNVLNIGNHFNQDFILFNENVLGDITSSIKYYSVPAQMKIIMSNEVPKFFITTIDGINEQVNPNILSIQYGIYVHDLLKYYYGFNSNIILSILKLILSQVLRNVNEDLLLVELSQFLDSVTGGSKTSTFQQTSAIKSTENELSMFLHDETGISTPVIYHNDLIDITTDVTMSLGQNLDDVYALITQLNTIRIIYVFDFGYEGNLTLLPMSVVVSKDSPYCDSGYLSIFTAYNRISL